jgi:hypothetical protein
MGSGDMMNVFAANELEAADLMALARYDDGAPAAVTPPPAGDGQGRPAMRVAGSGGRRVARSEFAAGADR